MSPCAVRYRYNAVSFIQNHHKWHPIARPLGRGMGCLLCSQFIIDIQPQSMQCHVILDRVIMAFDCTLVSVMVIVWLLCVLAAVFRLSIFSVIPFPFAYIIFSYLSFFLGWFFVRVFLLTCLNLTFLGSSYLWGFFISGLGSVFIPPPLGTGGIMF